MTAPYARGTMKTAGGYKVCLDHDPEVLVLHPGDELLATAAPVHGGQDIRLVDLSGNDVRTILTKSEFRTFAFSHDGSTVFVGSKNIATFDVATGKKGKVSFKGHKAHARALVVSDDGKTLYTAGGSRTYSDDCFVRAFDTSTGELRWSAKTPTKAKGFTGVAPLDGLVVASCEDGTLRAFDSESGEPKGLLALGEGATPGGIVASGANAVVPWEAEKKAFVGLVTLKKGHLTMTKTVEVALPEVDTSENVGACPPAANGSHGVVAFQFAQSGFPRRLACPVDLRAPSVGRAVMLEEANDVLGLVPTVFADGAIVWPVAQGFRSVAR